jgi:hypothetical protein
VSREAQLLLDAMCRMLNHWERDAARREQQRIDRLRRRPWRRKP